MPYPAIWGPTLHGGSQAVLAFGAVAHGAILVLGIQCM